MNLHIDSVDIDSQVRKGEKPVLMYPRTDGQIWHVADSSVLQDNTNWTLSRAGPRVRIPFIPYLVDRRDQETGYVGLGARVCQVVCKKFPDVHANSALLILVGKTDCREPMIQAGYDRIWMAVAYLEEK